MPENRVQPAPISDEAGSKGRRRIPGARDPYVLAAALFAAYATVSVLRFRRMETLSWDLGIFEQAIRGYAHLRAPVADLKGPGANILGDHFSPVTALLAPVYRIFPTPVTLLVAQSALFALSAVPVTRAAARLLGRGAGLALGVAYGLSWGLQRAADFDFHEICFAVPLIAFSLEAVLARRWRAALFWALPLVLVKEDLGLTVAAIAAVVALRTRRTSRRTAAYAAGVAAFGIAAVALTLTVVIPAFNSTGAYDYWSKTSGAGPFTASGTKLRTLLWLLLPTGLLALRSPLMLAAVPTIGWRFLSSDDHYWSTDWHYSAVLMPILALALADAVDSGRRSPRPWLRTYARQLPAAAAAAALALTTALPLSALTHSDTYAKSTEVSARERMLDRIPDGATVEANVGPISRLTSRCRVLWVGDARRVIPEYIALDNTSGWAGDPLEYARQLHPSARYAMTGVAYGYVLLERQT
ncbi:hypothetical protein BG418_33310 [Streptomyces sp. CBMA152]|nr:hypothetical protein [Streptomyces sp. CBMA152]